MEENKKKNSKTGLLIFFLIVSIIIIAIMAYYIQRLTEEKTIDTTTLETIEDNNFINLGVMYDFEFDNGKLSRIIYMM